MFSYLLRDHLSPVLADGWFFLWTISVLALGFHLKSLGYYFFLLGEVFEQGLLVFESFLSLLLSLLSAGCFLVDLWAF